MTTEKSVSSGGRRDPKLLSLPLPFKNAGNYISLNPEQILGTNESIFGRGRHENQPVALNPGADAIYLKAGDHLILGTRATPTISIEEDSDFSTLALCLGGSVHTYRSRHGVHCIRPGDAFLNPRDGGTMTCDYIAGIFMQINQHLLHQTIRAISGVDDRINLTQPWVLHQKNSQTRVADGHPLIHFFSFVDAMMAESTYLTEALGLGDQIYRLLAISLLQAAGLLEQARKGSAGQRGWNPRLDGLVDYIVANAHLNITLTDLEVQSHYSARHLHSLFNDKFDCTPMQFVRRQRLDTAMQKLQTANDGDTVASISRDCGYHFASNFSSDFQRHFGVKPSTVIRASRAGRRKPDLR